MKMRKISDIGNVITITEHIVADLVEKGSKAYVDVKGDWHEINDIFIYII